MVVFVFKKPLVCHMGVFSSLPDSCPSFLFPLLAFLTLVIIFSLSSHHRSLFFFFFNHFYLPFFYHYFFFFSSLLALFAFLSLSLHSTSSLLHLSIPLSVLSVVLTFISPSLAPRVFSLMMNQRTSIICNCLRT